LVVATNQGPEKGANMIIIGCDYHPGFQQIVFVDTETGEWKEQRLEHREAAEAFYRELASGAEKVRVGMEASGHAHWFERLLGELDIELWLGDAAVIRAKRAAASPRRIARMPGTYCNSCSRMISRRSGYRAGKTETCGNFCGIDHRMVQARTRLMSQLQAVALKEGLRCKRRLWREKGRKQLEAIRRTDDGRIC